MKIAVLVDLELTERSGGHVKYWLRISDSIKKSKLPFRITIFFLGKKKKDIKVSKNIEYKIRKPLFSSIYLKKIGVDADITDISPLNPFLLFELRKYDLIHTTDQFFSMSKTAMISAKVWSIPITTSIHTDTPPYTKYYVEKILKKYFSLFNLDRFEIPTFFEKRMLQKVYDYVSKVKHAMVADKIYSPEVLKEKTQNSNITKLNRGIDKKIFNIKVENETWVYKKYNIPKNHKIIFFSGRIHELKGAILLAKITKRLNQLGCSVTTLMAGDDIHGEECIRVSPKNLYLIGYLSPSEIARLYRVCDFFVFPSQFEIGPNVVLEAKACGSICIVSPTGGGKRIYKPDYDGIIINKYDAKYWANVIKDLISDKKKLSTMKKFISKQQPESWSEIFNRDISPYWLKFLKNNK